MAGVPVDEGVVGAAARTAAGEKKLQEWRDEYRKDAILQVSLGFRSPLLSRGLGAGFAGFRCIGALLQVSSGSSREQAKSSCRREPSKGTVKSNGQREQSEAVREAHWRASTPRGAVFRCNRRGAAYLFKFHWKQCACP